MGISQDAFTYVDRTGKESMPFSHYSGAGHFCDGRAVVHSRDDYGFIDKTGEERISPEYDFATSFFGNFARVRLGLKVGYIDKSGCEYWSD